MNAGGKKAVRWGTTIDNLLSWKMVLPNGAWLEVIRKNYSGNKIRGHDITEFELNYLKDDASTKINSKKLLIKGSEIRENGLGKDVTNKFLSGLPGVQKEGCDGIITSARFMLHKDNKYKSTVCLEFFGAKADKAVNAIVIIKNHIDNNSNINLTGLEHLDSRYIKAVNYTTKSSRTELPYMILLADISSDDTLELENNANDIKKIATKYGGECFVATDIKEQKMFWKDRANTAAIASHTNAFKINEDVVIPLDKLAEYSYEIEKINIILAIENKLANSVEVINYLNKITASHVYLEKHNLAKKIITDTIKNWQYLLDNIGDKDIYDKIQADKSVLSFTKSIKTPLSKIYRGDTFVDIIKNINAMHKKHKKCNIICCNAYARRRW